MSPKDTPQEHEVREGCKMIHDDYLKHKEESVFIRDAVKEQAHKLAYHDKIIEDTDNRVTRHKEDYDELRGIIADMGKQMIIFMEWMNACKADAEKAREAKEWSFHSVVQMILSIVATLSSSLLIYFLLNKVIVPHA